MFSTGLQKLDEFLSGGVPGGVITDIFGSSGTGKTQLLFQLSLNAIKENAKILYVDTSGSFRPERIIEIQKQTHHALNRLDNIAVLRVTNTHDQINSLQIINESDFDLVLVDNITDLFSYEYQNSERTFEKNLMFMQYMRGLSLYAIGKKIPIVVTNMVRSMDEKEVENMQTAIDPFIQIKISLFRGHSNFFGNAAWMQNSFGFSYKINSGGLTDTAEAI